MFFCIFSVRIASLEVNENAIADLIEAPTQWWIIDVNVVLLGIAGWLDPQLMAREDDRYQHFPILWKVLRYAIELSQTLVQGQSSGKLTTLHSRVSLQLFQTVMHPMLDEPIGVEVGQRTNRPIPSLSRILLKCVMRQATKQEWPTDP
jgi:hypothetical protein